MWIASKNGFFSIVKSDLEEDTWMVRARLKEDLEALNETNESNFKIVETEFSDYRFRIFISAAELINLMITFAGDIDYSNFKDKIKETKGQSEKVEAYTRIWAIMCSFQHEKYEFDLSEYYRERYGDMY